jgi:transcription elongation factor SPT4
MASQTKGGGRGDLYKLPQPKVIEQFVPHRSPCHPPHQPTSDPGRHRPLATCTMPRKGRATVKKKASKYVSTSSEEELSPAENGSNSHSNQQHGGSVVRDRRDGASDSENVDPAVAREKLKRSIEAHPQGHRAETPRQDLVDQQSVAFASSLFPNEDAYYSPHISSANARSPQNDRAVLEAFCRNAKPNSASSTSRTKVANPTSRAADAQVNRSPQRRQPRPAPPVDYQVPAPRNPDKMIQGGASIPANQQRNMRACMVCSIVRTQQQFTTQGCPNCEDILELAGNPEQVNDCTSQVFEGLISVADTNRSWVARYQRLEGYVPGVYATQVEGILPEDILVAVENAGINYVPRDGSEQEMLGKD